jgi:hypothetical protein
MERQSSDIATSEENLWGQVTTTSTRPFVLASAFMMMPSSGCSATLVAPDRLITAAHCTGNIVFAQLPNAQFPIVGASWPSNAKVCGDDWATTSDEDPVAYSPWDIAVVTIGPDPMTGQLPGITPVTPYLADTDIGFDTGRIAQSIWAVGYGNNVPAEWDPNACIGCGVRRSGPLEDVEMASDPCDVPLEVDCFRARILRARAIDGGEITEFSPLGSLRRLSLGCARHATHLHVGAAARWHRHLRARPCSCERPRAGGHPRQSK